MLSRLKRVIPKRQSSNKANIDDTHNPLIDNQIGQTTKNRQIKKEAMRAMKIKEIDEYGARLRISLHELISNAEPKQRTVGIYAYSLNRSFKFKHNHVRKIKDRFAINSKISYVLRELRSNKLITNWYWEPCMHSPICGYITIWL